MAKGAFYPELLTLHVYLTSPLELRQFEHNYFAELDSTLELLRRNAGSRVAAPKLGAGASDDEAMVAIGSFVHEYVHYLQYTTRFEGIAFYEFRFQQFLAVLHCLGDLRSIGVMPEFPLMHMWDGAVGEAKAVLDKWLHQWVAYEGVITCMGLGSMVGSEHQVESHYKANFPEYADPVLHSSDNVGTETSSTVDTTRILETEADYVTFQVLSACFGNRGLELYDKLMGGWYDSHQSSLMMMLWADGLAHLIPVVLDYAMQVNSLPKDSRVSRSTAARFLLMLEACRSRYSGIDCDGVMKHRAEIEQCISHDFGIPAAEDLMRRSIRVMSESELGRTALGRMLRRCVAYRMRNPLFFAIPWAYIFHIWESFPGAAWIYYNYGLLTESHVTRQDSVHAGALPFLDLAGLANLRQLLWAARELAARDTGYVCPDCMLKARRQMCSGDCAFVGMTEEETGFNPYTNKWR